MAGVHLPPSCVYLYSILWEVLSKFDQILHATSTANSHKKYSERKFEISSIQHCKPRNHSLYYYRDRNAERQTIYSRVPHIGFIAASALSKVSLLN